MKVRNESNCLHGDRGAIIGFDCVGTDAPAEEQHVARSHQVYSIASHNIIEHLVGVSPRDSTIGSNFCFSRYCPECTEID